MCVCVCTRCTWPRAGCCPSGLGPGQESWAAAWRQELRDGAVGGRGRRGCGEGERCPGLVRAPPAAQDPRERGAAGQGSAAPPGPGPPSRRAGSCSERLPGGLGRAVMSGGRQPGRSREDRSPRGRNREDRSLWDRNREVRSPRGRNREAPQRQEEAGRPAPSRCPGSAPSVRSKAPGWDRVTSSASLLPASLRLLQRGRAWGPPCAALPAHRLRVPRDQGEQRCCAASAPKAGPAAIAVCSV